MPKKPEVMGGQATKKPGGASARAVQMITVVEGDTRSYEELMKPPKAQIAKQIVIPPNKRRFIIDVDNQKKTGKQIIAVMEMLCDGDESAIKKFTQTVATLASPGAKKTEK